MKSDDSLENSPKYSFILNKYLNKYNYLNKYLNLKYIYFKMIDLFYTLITFQKYTYCANILQ